MEREPITTTRVVLTAEEAAALVILAGCEEAPGVLLPLPEVPVSPLDALRGTTALDGTGRVRLGVKEMLRVLENPGCCLQVARQEMTGSRVDVMSVFYDSPVGPFVIANKSADLRDLTLVPGPTELLAILDDLGSLSREGGAELPELVLGTDAMVALAAAVDVVAQQRAHAEDHGAREVELLLPEMTGVLLTQQVRARKAGVSWLLDLLGAASGGRTEPDAADVGKGLVELKLLGLFDEAGRASELGAMWIAVLGQTKELSSYQVLSAMEGKSAMGCLLRWETAAGWLLGAFGEGNRLALGPGRGGELVEAVLGLLEGPFFDLGWEASPPEVPKGAPPVLPEQMDPPPVGPRSVAPPPMPVDPPVQQVPVKRSGGGCWIAVIVAGLLLVIAAIAGFWAWEQWGYLLH